MQAGSLTPPLKRARHHVRPDPRSAAARRDPVADAADAAGTLPAERADAAAILDELTAGRADRDEATELFRNPAYVPSDVTRSEASAHAVLLGNTIRGRL